MNPKLGQVSWSRNLNHGGQAARQSHVSREGPNLAAFPPAGTAAAPPRTGLFGTLRHKQAFELNRTLRAMIRGGHSRHRWHQTVRRDETKEKEILRQRIVWK